MPKPSKPKAKKSQHQKFVELARKSGADESERAFVGKLRKIAPANSASTSKPTKPRQR